MSCPRPMVVDIMSAASSLGSTSLGQASLSTPVMLAYTAAGVLAYGSYCFIADREYSSVLSMSAIVQCLGFGFLCMQVLYRSSARGISANALTLNAIAVCLRLSSTMLVNGYIPVDATGDHFYQIMDLCSLALILFLLHQVLVVHHSSYQECNDSFRAFPTLFLSTVLAALLHGNMDGAPFYDTLWMAGLFTEVLAVLPQLWLITQSGSSVDPLTGHYIAALAFSRVLSGLFMWEARNDIQCDQWITGVEHAICAILAAHVLQLFLLFDFVYYYLRAIWRNGPTKSIELSGLNEVFL